MQRSQGQTQFVMRRDSQHGRPDLYSPGRPDLYSSGRPDLYSSGQPDLYSSASDTESRVDTCGV